MFKYIKTAFLNHWNLLAVFAGTGLAVVSGRPDVLMPIVIAGEVAYLGLLGTHPKFQKYVEAQDAKVEREKNSKTSQQVLRQIMQQLPQAALVRYEKLRTRCVELRQIANDLKQTGGAVDAAPIDSFQLAGLDRLMWIFLRLQFTQYSLGKFLERTSLERIHLDLKQVETRLEQLEGDETEHAQKMRHTLTDNRQTCQDRLANYEKAQSNYELVSLEIDRLENKIRTVAELGINRQEPDYISSQVDQVTKSMVDTEKTMNDLQFATGLGPLEEEVPELVESQAIRITQ